MVLKPNLTPRLIAQLLLCTMLDLLIDLLAWGAVSSAEDVWPVEVSKDLLQRMDQSSL